MEVERVADADGRVAMWTFDWDITASPASKKNRQFIGFEQRIKNGGIASPEAREAICWSYGRTLGNISVSCDEILESFSAPHGEDAILMCDIVEAGKMRNGVNRWWCRTHQKHWGTNGDIAAARKNGKVQCANHLQRMSYIVNPRSIKLDEYSKVEIRCALAPALTNFGIPASQKPRIHVEALKKNEGSEVIAEEFSALSLHYNADSDLFENNEKHVVHITPPAALEFILGLEADVEMGCIKCKNCDYPHLDLGDFARVPHSKHLCSNCGRDNTWSKLAIASTPLKPLYDQFTKTSKIVVAGDSLNIDDYPNATFSVWASTPAILSTSGDAQKRGIHVHLQVDGNRIIDDTFGNVIYKKKALSRLALLKSMVKNTLI